LIKGELKNGCKYNQLFRHNAWSPIRSQVKIFIYYDNKRYSYLPLHKSK
jgi:hypothetical protein